MDKTIASVDVGIAVDTAAAGGKVDRAVFLNRQVEAFSKELDAVKAELRALAATGAFPSTETGAVEIRSLESGDAALVAPVKDTPTLVKGADVTALKACLTASQYDLLFREVVQLQPASDFEAAFAQLPKKLQERVKKAVSWRPNTPQVRLPR